MSDRFRMWGLSLGPFRSDRTYFPTGQYWGGAGSHALGNFRWFLERQGLISAPIVYTPNPERPGDFGYGLELEELYTIGLDEIAWVDLPTYLHEHMGYAQESQPFLCARALFTASLALFYVPGPARDEAHFEFGRSYAELIQSGFDIDQHRVWDEGRKRGPTERQRRADEKIRPVIDEVDRLMRENPRYTLERAFLDAQESHDPLVKNRALEIPSVKAFRSRRSRYLERKSAD